MKSPKLTLARRMKMRATQGDGSTHRLLAQGAELIEGLLAAAKKQVGAKECHGKLDPQNICILMTEDESEWCGHCQLLKAIELAEARDE